ncbi:MAG: hypothetical protein V1772_07690, partial [Chloroflexota bacterium]
MNKETRILYIVLGLAVVVLLVHLGALFFPLQPGPVAGRPASGEVTRPTRTPAPPTATLVAAATPVPPTATPVASATLVAADTPMPPTATPVPATETPVPPTDTPAPTDTPLPPSATPRPPTRAPTRRPPTAAPPPVGFLASVGVDNGAFGKEGIYVNYQEQIHATASNGQRYGVELGFLSHPTSLQKVADYWKWGARGGGNWKMIILMRTKVSWMG